MRHFIHSSFFVFCFLFVVVSVVVVSCSDDEAVANFRIRNRSMMMMFLLLLFLRFVMDNIDDFAAEAAKRKDGHVVLLCVFRERERERVKVVYCLLFIARVTTFEEIFPERFSTIST